MWSEWSGKEDEEVTGASIDAVEAVEEDNSVELAAKAA